MTIVSIDFDDLNSLLKNEIEKTDFISKIQLIGAEVEREEGNHIDIEFFPDRPDLFSVEGVARAVNSFYEYEPGFKNYKIKNSEVKMKVEKSVRDVRPYVVCAIVKDIEMSGYLVKSLMDLQEKLHFGLGRKRKKASIGVHDFKNINPPFTYKAIDPQSTYFVPLTKSHKMNLDEILKYHEKGIDYAHLLKGYDKYPIITDKNNEILSFPPIINGNLTTVTYDTKDIFIDVTGLEFNAINYCLNIVTTALAERGGKLESVQIIYDDKTINTPKLNANLKKIEINYINKIIGLNLTQNEIINSLHKMGFGVKINSSNNNILEVEIPPYRSDIMHPVDIVEDIAIGYGIDKLTGILPESMTFGKSRELENLCERLRNHVIGLGFNEVMTFTLSSDKDQFEKMCLNDDENCVILKNPLSMDFNILRVSLIPSLLNILKANKHRVLPQRIFEIGDVVLNTKNQRKISSLSIHSKASFTESKSLAEAIMRELNEDYEIVSKNHNSFIGGRCAGIIVDGKEIGFFGELHPKVITAFELAHPINALEIKI